MLRLIVLVLLDCVMLLRFPVLFRKSCRDSAWIPLLKLLVLSITVDLGLRGSVVLQLSLKIDASWYPLLSLLFLEWQIVNPLSNFCTASSGHFSTASKFFGTSWQGAVAAWCWLSGLWFADGGFGAGRRFRWGGFGRAAAAANDSLEADFITGAWFWMAGGVTDRLSSLWVGEIERVSLEIEPEPMLWNRRNIRNYFLLYSKLPP